MTSKNGTSPRPYERTHPWISFDINLKHIDYDTWIKLGAVQSKCEQVANVMVSPAVGKRLLSLYLAKGVAATTAIEGNTLSERQVLQRIHRKGQALPPSQEYQGKEIDNIVEACNVISKQMINDEQDCDITPERIASFNAMVLKDLPLEEGVAPGQLRQYSVGVGDYRGAPFEDCEYLLRRLCDWINHIKQEENKVPIAVLRAVLAHLYLAWIHPFGDGNGRTARLIEFQILLGVGMPTVACHLLSNHYNKTRSEYYRQLSLASKTRDVFPFIRYAVQGLVDQLDSQIRKIREYQHSVVWKDYVYDRFRDKKTPAAHRQRQLALELGMRREPDSPRSITSIPEMGNAYSGKTRKTITRDIHELERLGLTIRVGARSFKANTAALRAFRPARRNAAKRQ